MYQVFVNMGAPQIVFVGRENFQVWLGFLGHWGPLDDASTLRSFSAISVNIFGFT